MTSPLTVKPDDYAVDGECWIWSGRLQNRGYGLVRNKTQIALAHRVAYEQFVGPIPDGLVLDHLCRRRDCINPDHLEPITNRENILRGSSPMAEALRSGKCGRGHEFTPENTYVRKSGKRECRECRNATKRRHWHASKSLA